MSGNENMIGFHVGNFSIEVGSASFLHAFFSTISYHLEPNGWGTSYPELMFELYQGKLNAKDVSKVLDDLHRIREAFKSLKPDMVVWNIENLEEKPPWGSNISSDITDLSNYFVTNDGEDLFDVLNKCLNYLQQGKGQRLTIE